MMKGTPIVTKEDSPCTAGNRFLAAIIAALGQGAALAVFANDTVNAGQVVKALEDAFGVDPGQRRNHIKGVCAAGQFIGSPEIGRYRHSALFSGKPVPIVARFPVAGTRSPGS